MNFPDGAPVILDERLEHGQVVCLFAKVYAHCMDCLQEKIDECNRRYAIVQTVPPCLLNKETGELEELPESPGMRWEPRFALPRPPNWRGFFNV